MKYDYKSNFENETYSLYSYPIETCVSEKYETMISKGINNSRSKDLLDIYLYQKQKLDIELLNAAFINTFNLRKTKLEFNYINETLEKIFNNTRIKELYNNYQSKHKFASNISFNMCKSAIYNIFSKLTFNEKISLSDYGIEYSGTAVSSKSLPTTWFRWTAP